MSDDINPTVFPGVEPLALNHLVAPTVNLNGSSGKTLLEGYVHVLEELSEVIHAVQNTNPHGRDYQTVPHGQPGYAEARAQHIVRLLMLERLRSEYSAMALAVQEQQNRRRG